VRTLAQPTKLVPTDAQKRLTATADAYFRGRPQVLTYVQVDKPLYQPGETIWYRAHVQQAATLTGAQGGISFHLVSPKGDVVLQKRVQITGGVASNDFVVPAEASGGEYLMRAIPDDGSPQAERAVIIATYQAPRLKKKLEFQKKAYGPGDSATAIVKVERATGEPFANKALTGLVTIDDVEVTRVAVSTDAAGGAIVRFKLPPDISRGDGLLTILADDGGVTESVQKRVPIVLDKLALTMFPEGGDLVVGLPSRVYFEAQNSIGKPADVRGVVKDDRGRVITKLASIRDGMGRFALTPERGRSYHIEIESPPRISTKYDLPAAQAKGCTLRAADDPAQLTGPMRVAVSCSSARTIVASALLRERQLATLSAHVVAGTPTLFALPIDQGAGAGIQGAVRVTLFDTQLNPLAERLIYRGRGANLKLKITADKKTYGPRDEVALTVETRDLAGEPVTASLGLSVVDDTVLSFADDKEPTLLAQLYLRAALPVGQDKLDDANFYFSDAPEAPSALDAVLGTRGWRRFEWQQVLMPPVPTTVATGTGGMAWPQGAVPAEVDMAAAEPMGGARNAPGAVPMPAPPMVAQREVQKEEAAKKPMNEANNKQARIVVDAKDIAGERDWNAAGGKGDLARGGDMDEEMGNINGRANQWGWAAVRQFPVPKYAPGYEGPRNDFRETIYWNPSVTTDAHGKATVKFFMSDAVTSFRVSAEGASLGGLPGRGDAVIQSKLPLSLEARLPLEASIGDTLRLPVTFSNETSRSLKAQFSATIGAAFQIMEQPAADLTLSPGERRSAFVTLKALRAPKAADDPATAISLRVTTAGLSDQVERQIRVVARGYPETASFAGTLTAAASAHHNVDLASALPGTVNAIVTLYPSPLSTMIQGGEAMLQEPYGCFEQASSTNYPNVMVTQYMIAHDVADAALLEKTQGLLDRGYKKIAGYESPKQGFEWFGGDPGHEALTAYGVLEFSDMSKVYPSLDRSMVERTTRWLLSRRDGKGGFKRDAKALDSFGAASPEVTNAYIAYALSEAGGHDLAPELAALRPVATGGKDPYVVALATLTLINAKAAGAADGARHLMSLAGTNGNFPGADHSITRSGGLSLEVETTAFATMALMKAADTGVLTRGDVEAPVRAGIDWLNKSRSGLGGFGATQGTVLAIKAMNQYEEFARRTDAAGTIELRINGKVAGRQEFAAGHQGAIVFDDVAAALRQGKNDIEVTLVGSAQLPYSVAVEYRTALPHSSPDSVVDISTKLAKPSTKLGQTVRLTANIANRTDKGQPMTLARVGLPGGLTFQTWQLKELRDKGLIDFYETRPREVILYFRDLAPKAKKTVNLDLMPTVPGRFEGPASSAYLYYTNEAKTWIAPLMIEVTE